MLVFSIHTCPASLPFSYRRESLSLSGAETIILKACALPVQNLPRFPAHFRIATNHFPPHPPGSSTDHFSPFSHSLSPATPALPQAHQEYSSSRPFEPAVTSARNAYLPPPATWLPSLPRLDLCFNTSSASTCPALSLSYPALPVTLS